MDVDTRHDVTMCELQIGEWVIEWERTTRKSRDVFADMWRDTLSASFVSLNVLLMRGTPHNLRPLIFAVLITVECVYLVVCSEMMRQKSPLAILCCACFWQVRSCANEVNE